MGCVQSTDNPYSSTAGDNVNTNSISDGGSLEGSGSETELLPEGDVGQNKTKITPLCIRSNN